MSDVTIRPAREADFDDVIALYEEFHAFHVLGVPHRLCLPASAADPAQLAGERAQICAQLLVVLENASAALLLAETEG